MRYKLLLVLRPWRNDQVRTETETNKHVTRSIQYVLFYLFFSFSFFRICFFVFPSFLFVLFYFVFFFYLLFSLYRKGGDNRVEKPGISWGRDLREAHVSKTKKMIFDKKNFPKSVDTLKGWKFMEYSLFNYGFMCFDVAHLDVQVDNEIQITFSSASLEK